MRKEIHFLLFFFLCLASIPLAAQNIEVKGVVTEAATNEPLPGVTVKIKGHDTGTVTDMDGKYSVKANKGAILVFSTIGMKQIEKAVTSSAPIHVSMEEDNIALEQVVVIGYGTVKKSHLSGAVSSVTAKELNGQVASNAATALQGKIAGVSVASSSGDPNGGMTINVRGISSLSNNDPLYVIDGAFGDISMVDPNDITSIEVLKDAASAAIYGSRAAGGVVIITTKSGRKDTPTKLDINFFTGISHNPKKLNVFNGEEYSRFARYYSLAGDGYGAEAGAVPFVGEGTDWQDVMLNTAMAYKANATISGGSKTGAYSASVSYLNKEGILRNTNHESYNIRLKSDYSFFNNRLTIGQSMIVRLTKGKGNIDQDTMFGILQFPTVIPVFDSTNTGGGWGTSTNINLPNPLGISDVIDNTNENTKIFLNAYLQAEIIKDLKYKFNVGIRKEHGKSRTYTDTYDLGTYGRNDAPDLREGSSTYDSWVIENTLNYDKTFGRHNLSLLAGYSAQKDKHHSLNGSNSDLPKFIDTMTGNTSTMSASSNLKELALVSLFGRVMYSYDDRYLFSASIRRDGSSRFGKGHQYGSFPSASIGWNINREKFFKPLENIFDQIKIRASYGKLGNQEIGDNYYPTLSIVSDGMNYLQGNNIWFGQMPFVNAVSPANLTWENTETYNIGLDISVLNGRLTITADAYIKNTNDVLLPIPYAGSTGISGLSIQNAGQVRNKGFEFSANYRGSIKNKFNYYVGANISTEKNEVRKITAGGHDMTISGYSAHGQGGRGINMFQEGHTMSYFNLIETDGIFRSAEEIENYKTTDGKLIQPGAQVGDIRYKDWNGDGVINSDDQHDVGNPFPDFTFGLRLGGDWNNFDFNLFFDGMVGNKIYNYPRYRLESGNFNGNYSTTLANSWRPDNQNTDLPRFTTETSDNKWAYTDRWLENGSYMRLKTLDIGYTLPKQFLKKFKLGNVRIYTSMENLFTLTKYSGYTPDLGESGVDIGTTYNVFSRGIDQGRYPLPRTISFGIQVNL